MRKDLPGREIRSFVFGQLFIVLFFVNSLNCSSSENIGRIIFVEV